jgi:hypothetical protein
MRKINCKRISVDSDDIKQLLKKNKISQIPLLIIKHADDDTNRIIGCDNILKFVEHFTRMNTKIERVLKGVFYTSSLPEDVEDYDLVILVDKVNKVITEDNIIKYRDTEQGLSLMAEKLKDSVKKVLVVSTKKNPYCKVVGSLYLSLIEDKSKEEVEEELDVKLEQLNSSLLKIIAHYLE